MRLALTGAPYSGKSTLARYLRDECGWTYLNYTDRIKADLATALNAVYQTNQYTVEHIHADKRRFRALLQELGSYMKYDRGYGVVDLLAEWKALGLPGPVVWDNVRFDAQFELLKRNGFVLVGLQVSKATQRQRALDAGVDAEELERMGRHVAEAGVQHEIMLDGDLPTEQNAEILNRLCNVYVRPAKLSGVGARRTAAKSQSAVAVH